MATTLDDVTLEIMETNSKLAIISDDLKTQIDYDDLLVDTIKEQFTNLIQFLESAQKPSLSDIESQREARSQGLSVPTTALTENQGGVVGTGSASGGGGLLGMLGGAKAAGIGIGAGALAGGLGVLAGGGAYLLKTLQDLDTKTLKENVNNLLSIGDSFKDGSLDFLKAGGTFFLVMTGLGLGLIAFSAGQGFAAAVDYFTKDSKFAENIKSNVKTLLSISDEVDGLSGALLETGTFVSLMTGLASGLIAFSLGSGAASIVDSFSKEGWAQRIKDNVKTLLSISDEVTDEKATMLGKSGAFALSMAGIAAGLTVFAVGQLASGLANTFSSEGWAKKIKDNVKEIVSIADLFESDKKGEKNKADSFKNSMMTLSAGILAFTASEAIGSLGAVGKTILGFFGVDSPFDEIMKVAEKAADLEKGANAIEKIAKALNSFGGIKIGDIDIDFVELAENLGKAIPFIDALANGGEVKGSGSWLSDPLVFEKGLLDPSLRVDELAKQIEKVNYVLGTGEKPSSMKVSPAAKPAAVDRFENLTTEELILKATQEGKENSRQNAINNNVQNNVSSVNNNSTIVKPNPSPVRQPNSPSDVFYGADISNPG